LISTGILRGLASAFPRTNSTVIQLNLQVTPLFFCFYIRLSVTGKKGGQANNGDVLQQMALQDKGIAYLPSWLIEQDVQADRLVELLADFTPAPCRFMRSTLRISISS